MRGLVSGWHISERFSVASLLSGFNVVAAGCVSTLCDEQVGLGLNVSQHVTLHKNDDMILSSQEHNARFLIP